MTAKVSNCLVESCSIEKDTSLKAITPLFNWKIGIRSKKLSLNQRMIIFNASVGSVRINQTHHNDVALSYPQRVSVETKWTEALLSR